MHHDKFIAAGLVLGMLALPAIGQAPGGQPKTAKPALTAPAALKGDPVAGRLKSEEERCQECHGHDGNAQDIEDGVGNIGKFPRLAGQLPAYIVKQMRDFRSGARQNDTMAIMARSVSDADVADIAAYFASQKTAGDKIGDAAHGRRLYLEGDASRGIPACLSCHGETAQGRQLDDTVYPRLGGQHQRYVTKQLNEWKRDERKNSQGGIMNQIARQLTESDIEQLSSYLVGQP